MESTKSETIFDIYPNYIKDPPDVIVVYVHHFLLQRDFKTVQSCPKNSLPDYWKKSGKEYLIEYLYMEDGNEHKYDLECTVIGRGANMRCKFTLQNRMDGTHVEFILYTLDYVIIKDKLEKRILRSPEIDEKIFDAFKSNGLEIPYNKGRVHDPSEHRIYLPNLDAEEKRVEAHSANQLAKPNQYEE